MEPYSQTMSWSSFQTSREPGWTNFPAGFLHCPASLHLLRPSGPPDMKDTPPPKVTYLCMFSVSSENTSKTGVSLGSFNMFPGGLCSVYDAAWDRSLTNNPVVTTTHQRLQKKHQTHSCLWYKNRVSLCWFKLLYINKFIWIIYEYIMNYLICFASTCDFSTVTHEPAAKHCGRV